MATPSDIIQSFQWFDSQLREAVNFWLSKSVDHKNGGYYNCLNSAGEIYDKTKYGWLQGRQVWMLSKLYNQLPEYRRTDVLDAAVKGGEFLLDFVKVKNELRCYFAVTETGLPIHLQRKPYTECFYVIGLSELYKAISEERYLIAAEEMLHQVIHWICVDNTSLGKPQLSGSPPTRELGYPMILLNVLSEVCENNAELRAKYSDQFKWCIEAILSHHDGQWVHEHILKTGGFPEGSLGRLSIPGHAIEGGWFLLQEALFNNNLELCNTAIKQFIEMPYHYGWDKQFDGLYYYLDKEGHSPTQLEWNMKLWWVHCEALVATLMAYQTTLDPNHWLMFKQVFEYVVDHFPDGEHGEWFGYFNREGIMSHSFKGGPFKGCFHVPRTLYLCRKIMKELQEANI